MLSTVLYSLLLALGGSLLALAVYGVAKLNALVSAKVKSAYLQSAILRLDNAAMNATKSVYQTFVSPLKAAGGLSDANKAAAKAAALAEMKSYLGEKGLQEIMFVLGLGSAKDPNAAQAAPVAPPAAVPSSVDAVLSTSIEAAVSNLK